MHRKIGSKSYFARACPPGVITVLDEQQADSEADDSKGHQNDADADDPDPDVEKMTEVKDPLSL